MNIPGLETSLDDSLSEVMSRLNCFGKGPVHHPPCPRHDDHLIYIKGCPFCLGCFCVYTGIGLGFLAIFLLVYILGLELLTLASTGFVLAVIPSFIQIKFQKRAFKIVSRTLLGVGMIFWFWAILVMLPLSREGVLLRLGGTAFFFLMTGITHFFRGRFGKASHCGDCPEGDFPICSFRLPLMEEMIKELEEKGEQDSRAYDFLGSSRRKILGKDVSPPEPSDPEQPEENLM